MSECSGTSLQLERVCIDCYDRLLAARKAIEEEEQRREREVEETVKRLSALQAAAGFFPDENDDENCTPKALVSFVQQYAVRRTMWTACLVYSETANCNRVRVGRSFLGAARPQ